MGGGEAKQEAYYTAKQSEEMLFNNDSEYKMLDLFSKTEGVTKDEVEALRRAKITTRRLVGTEDGKPIITDFRDDPFTFSAYKKFRTFREDRNKSLKELEERNKFWDKGRNQTILTQDLPKTILGGAK